MSTNQNLITLKGNKSSKERLRSVIVNLALIAATAIATYLMKNAKFRITVGGFTTTIKLTSALWILFMLNPYVTGGVAIGTMVGGTNILRAFIQPSMYFGICFALHYVLKKIGRSKIKDFLAVVVFALIHTLSALLLSAIITTLALQTGSQINNSDLQSLTFSSFIILSAIKFVFLLASYSTMEFGNKIYVGIQDKLRNRKSNKIEKGENKSA